MNASRRVRYFAGKMSTPPPQRPKNLNPLAAELLEGLAGHPECAEIVLGGGVALSHYLEYRPTVDVDAWWREAPSAAARARIRAVLGAMAARHGLDFRERNFGDTESFELLRGKKKTFSCQISQRTLFLDRIVPASWPPLAIETLRDNAASKMAALVQRSAPRDFSDIHELVTRGFFTAAELWALWERKQPGGEALAAKRRVLAQLEGIAARVPLDSISDQERRAKAQRVRDWFARDFCQP